MALIYLPPFQQSSRQIESNRLVVHMCVQHVWRHFGVLETRRPVFAVVKMSVPKQLNKLVVNVSKSEASQFNSVFSLFWPLSSHSTLVAAAVFY